MPTEPSVKLCRTGEIGRVTLNRPSALNALNLEMIRSIRSALERWREDPSVRCVALDAVGPTFCAGGDIGVVHESAKTDPEIARRLWRHEYRLDACITRYPKPVVVVMDGITMGGGLGLGGHAAVRVVTERSVVAMPEVAIGLAPDVGGAFLLSRAPGEVGTHVALTAKRLGPADAVYCGLADHVVASGDVAAMLDELARGKAAPDPVAERHRAPAADAPLRAERPWIDACYGGADTTVERIAGNLGRRSEAEASTAGAALDAGAPTALKVTLRALRLAGSMSSLEECLRQDYRVSNRFLLHPDLREGIRAAIIDKDRTPQWHPSALGAVSEAEVARFFTPLDRELDLP